MVQAVPERLATTSVKWRSRLTLIILDVVLSAGKAYTASTDMFNHSSNLQFNREFNTH
ncbi:hypothetical protein J2853_008958 [Streptosporangium lutulentum]|uniref:Uncharacterized protein n=1 Tax=Streptosporangium lutulentum TaxID=1461250 RepID=A0ABT9QSK8_9ACTN|nr:hypothetical protein [Streptosporangium lutulentum]